MAPVSERNCSVTTLIEGGDILELGADARTGQGAGGRITVVFVAETTNGERTTTSDSLVSVGVEAAVVGAAWPREFGATAAANRVATGEAIAAGPATPAECRTVHVCLLGENGAHQPYRDGRCWCMRTSLRGRDHTGSPVIASCHRNL